MRGAWWPIGCYGVDLGGWDMRDAIPTVGNPMHQPMPACVKAAGRSGSEKMGFVQSIAKKLKAPMAKTEYTAPSPFTDPMIYPTSDPAKRPMMAD